VRFGLKTAFMLQVAADPYGERVDGGDNRQDRQGHEAEGDDEVHR